MAVNSRAFVEPAFLQRRIHAHGDDIRATVVQIFAQVSGETAIAALLAAEIMTVDPDDGITEHTIELDADALAQIGDGNRERLAIPADAGLREVTADCLEAMTLAAALA